MFFSISREPRDNFSNVYKLGPFTVYTDNGWNFAKVLGQDVVYKGYAEQDNLDQLLPTIVQQHDPELLGNFCVITYDPLLAKIKIKTDRYRGFPLYLTENVEVTNLVKLGKTAWTDSLVSMNTDYQITEEKFNLVGDIDLSPISREQAVEKIAGLLDKSVKDFLSHNQLPVRVHLSGGIDSTLVYSFLSKFTNNYELLTCQHFDYDRFWLKNSGDIKKNYWAYNQLHHWKDSCVLASGAPGDEFMLRGPVTVDLYLKFHGVNVVDLLNLPQWQGCLMQSYFKKSSNYIIFKEQRLDHGWDQEMLYWNLCNNIVNDWQHWHLGNTLTWTPLRNLEIFKIFLRLPLADALSQIMNASISQELIKRNNPELLQLLSNQKNSGNVMENLDHILLNE